ncbi:MAG: hypothetical protein HKN36_06865 [Hellea sp.]|nr:hypothetical protein [Hellea sp.]
MKWLFRIFGVIIGLFLLSVFVGLFISSNLSVERSSEVYAIPEDVFPYLSDLESHAIWAPWQGPNNEDKYLVGGSDEGVGQQAVWTCDDEDCLPGMQEITVIQYPEFVQAELNLNGRPINATYALMGDENNDGSVTVLLKVDMEVGGFPYVQRLFKFQERKALSNRLDLALVQLETLLKADGMAD